MMDNISIRITLSTLLIDEDKIDEAISLLCPPKDSGMVFTIFFYVAHCSLFSVF
jgi:hypothetical protein